MADFDNTQAATEGWCISECHGSDNGPYQLQRDDEAEVFASDDEAWLFVFRKVAEGSEYHRQAILFLEKESPFEYEAFAAYCDF